MRGLLIEACQFSWDAISPAIFGSLFQSVMDTRARRAAGAHYITEKNIIKRTFFICYIASGKRTMKPSRFGIFTFGKVCAFIASLSPISLFNDRM
jgi:hypothetical protein